MGGIQTVVMNPLARTITIIMLLAVFVHLAAAVNTWYLFTKDVGIVAGERIDRVVGYDITNGEEPNDAWKGATEGSSTATALDDGEWLPIKADGSGCQLAAGTIAINPLSAYTPSGERVAMTAEGGITGCQWTPESSLFKGILGSLITIILSAAGLGLPIGAIMALASYGSVFTQRMGMSPLLGAIVMVIGFLLVASLLSTLIPFVEVALSSLDGNRFAMYQTGLGALATIIGGFWGVVLVAGLLFIAWQVVGHFRSAGTGSSNVFSSGGRADRM